MDYPQSNAFLLNNLLGRENKTLLLIGLALLILPLFSLNQLIVGMIVNALLIKSAISYRSKKVYLLSVLPSLSVFFGGVLFANMSYSVFFMLPFIWAGNFILMFLMKNLHSNKKISFFSSSILAGTLKTALLFLSAFILYSMGAVPEIFLLMFGAMQFVTAQMGAVLVFVIGLIPKKV